MTMPSEADIDAAHPEAFDYVMGVLDPAEVQAFRRHMDQCHHCRAVADEYRELGQKIQNLPPTDSPSPGLEERTVAAMVRAMADRRPTRDYPAIHDVSPVSGVSQRDTTRAYPIPGVSPLQP